jgi:PAS domain S-box-containing protein
MLFKKRFILLIVLSAALLLSLSGCSQEKEELKKKAGLTEINKWQYFSGDSKFDSTGIPTILTDSAAIWQDYDLYNAPRFFGTSYVWMRGLLPETQLTNPYIFIGPFTVGQSFEVYIDKKLIYKFGILERSYSNKYNLPHWHSIRVAKSAKNKYVYFRFYSDDPPILGFRRFNEGDVTISLCDGDKLFSWIVKSQLDQLLIGLFLFFLGIFLIYLYLRRKGNRKTPVLFSLGFMTICVGLYTFSGTSFSQIIYDQPALWWYFSMFGLILFPVGLWSFIGQIIENERRQVFPKLAFIHLVFFFLAFFLELLNLVPKIFIIFLFILLLIVSILISAKVVFLEGKSGNKSAQTFSFALGILLLFGIHDILFSFHVVLFPKTIFHWGVLVFFLFLSSIIEENMVRIEMKLKQYSKELEKKSKELEESNRKLGEYSLSLEQKVTERTQDLETKNSELTQVVGQLGIVNMELRESENKFKIVTETTSACIFIHCGDVFLYTNSKFVSVSGYSNEELSKMKYYEIIDPEYTPLVQERFNARFRGEKAPENYEVKLRKKNGSEYWLDLMIGRLEFENKQAILVTGYDITQRKSAEAKLIESDETLKKITSSAYDAIIMMDHMGKVSYWNEAAEKMFGYTSSEALGISLHDTFIPKYYVEKFTENFSKFKLTGKGDAVGTTTQLNGLRRDGTEFPIEISLSGVLISGKWNAVGIVRDITERKNYELKLRHRADFEKIIGKISSSFINLDREKIDKVFLENGSFKNAQLYKAMEMLGKFMGVDRCYIFKINSIMTSMDMILEWCSPDTLPVIHYMKGIKLVPEIFEKVRADGFLQFDQSDNFFKKVNISIPKESSDLQYSVLNVPLIWEGKSYGIIGFDDRKGTRIWDKEDLRLLKVLSEIIVSAIKHDEAQEDLRKAKEEAESANRAKSEFLANMSHEIRTPMNAILGFSEILMNKISNPQHKSYLSTILNSGKTLLSLINDILDLSKIEAGKMELQPEVVNVSRILKEMQQMFSPKAAEKGLDLLLDISENMPGGLIFDEVRLRQIILNIIGNAIKFTDKGFVKIRGSFDYEDKENQTGRITVAIQDTGIGIFPDQQKIIFDSFQQQSGQSTRMYGGTGLGLAITKKLVEKMNGKITLVSEVGKGSTFILEFPDVEVNLMLSAESDESHSGGYDIEFEPSTLLMVDDIEYNRDLIKSYLEDTKINLIEAASGDEALEKLSKQKFDLMLLDMRMPGKDGYEVINIIRRDPKYDKMPIIAFTASAMKDQESKIKQLFEGFLRKPVERNKLFAEMMKFIPFKKSSIILDESKNIQNADEKITNELNLMIPDLISKLEKDYFSKWENIKDEISIDLIEDFMNELKKLYKKYPVYHMKNYISAMDESIQSFDIDQIKRILNKYPEFIENVKSLV